MKKKIAVILLLLALAAAFRLCRPPDEQRAEALLEQALNRDSYGFSARAVLIMEDAETPYFQLQGRIEGDSSQVSGTVLGEEVELSYADGVLYRTLPDGSRVSRQLADLGELGELYAELLPLSAFAHRGVAAYAVQRQKNRLELRLCPEEALDWVGRYFRDPRYIISCGPLGRRVRSLTLEATEKVNGSAVLRLEVVMQN